MYCVIFRPNIFTLISIQIKQFCVLNRFVKLYSTQVKIMNNSSSRVSNVLGMNNFGLS